MALYKQLNGAGPARPMIALRGKRDCRAGVKRGRGAHPPGQPNRCANLGQLTADCAVFVHRPRLVAFVRNKI